MQQIFLTRIVLLLAVTCLGFPLPARAQLRLPPRPMLPSVLPGAGLSLDLRNNGRDVVNALAPPDLQALRHDTIAALLHQYRERLEADPAGEPTVRGEVVVTAPSASLVAGATTAGFVFLREENLDPLDLRVVILRAPPSVSTADAVRRLRTIDPQASIDFNHVYTGSGRTDAVARTVAPTSGTVSAADPSLRIGLIDSGVDSVHATLRDVPLQRAGCGGHAVPDAHGTAIASLMVGNDMRFQGVHPGAGLYAADVACGVPSGSSVDAIVAALAWMAQQGIGVVNISLVGPANQVLERVVRVMVARGHLLVAAVGNDGPAAPPLYPASYAGVIGVTAIDGQGRVLPEAARGPQVMFAAPGADMVAAGGQGHALVAVRGTSFAAPIVAGMLAGMLPRPDPAMAATARSRLIATAHASGAVHDGKDRDAEVGYGTVGLAYRHSR